MILHVLVRGSPESIEMLGSILAPAQPSPFVQDELGGWLSLEVDSPAGIGGAVAELENLVDLAAGAMGLWANCRDRPRVTNLNYKDPKTERERGLLLNAFSIVAPLSPEILAEPTPLGVPRGTASLHLASQDAAVARALAVLASGGNEWWELYILLEVLRDSIGRRPDRPIGRWKDTLQALANRYGRSVGSLQNLKQTINYHRHAASALPTNPWDHAEAVQFVRTAIRDWLDERIASETV